MSAITSDVHDGPQRRADRERVRRAMRTSSRTWMKSRDVAAMLDGDLATSYVGALMGDLVREGVAEWYTEKSGTAATPARFLGGGEA